MLLKSIVARPVSGLVNIEFTPSQGLSQWHVVNFKSLTVAGAAQE
jgi:hypothetical protein